MGYYLGVLFLLIAVVLQNTVLPSLRLANGQIELVLVLVLGWSIHAEREEALWWAFIGGIAQDLLNIVPTGTSLIALISMVFLIKSFGDKIYRFSWIFLLIFVGIGTILYQIVILLMLALIIGLGDIGFIIQSFSLPTLLLNLAVALPLYILLRAFQRRIPERPSPR